MDAQAAPANTPCRLAISTMSLGQAHAGHTLEHRLDLARQHGYEGVELFFDDLEDLARALPAASSEADTTDDRLLRAAALARDLCDRRGLAVICLQPFRHYEGLLSRAEHAARLDELRLWCRLAAALRTDLILVPSSFLPAGRLADDADVLVRDLRDAADVAAAAVPPVRLCYEALAWGTRVDAWQASWDLVRRVGRANLGLCLDTFNMAARVYADPAVAGGVRQKKQQIGDDVDDGGDGAAAMEASLRALVQGPDAVDVRKLFLVQIADGARLDAPLRAGHPLYDAAVKAAGSNSSSTGDWALPPRLVWSRNHRLFYGEASRGAYLPVRRIAEAIFGGLGYRGWVSFELFNRRMGDTDAGVPAELAQRGAEAWAKLVRDVGLPTGGGGDQEGGDKSGGDQNGSDKNGGGKTGGAQGVDGGPPPPPRYRSFARKCLDLCGWMRAGFQGEGRAKGGKPGHKG